MKNELVFNGINLADYGVEQVDSIDAWAKPSRKYTKVAVPGRNGDLLIDEGAYENVPVPYRCVMPKNFKDNYLALMSMLTSFGGYKRLEYSGDPEVYRMGKLETAVQPIPSSFLKFGTFPLSFDCQPQRWLKSGENWVSFTASGAIFNPTSQKAQPIIRIYGTGTVMIGSKTITVNTAGTSYIDFDCSTLNAYEGAFNRNGNISIDFQEMGLVPGNNGITLNGVTVSILPRWWEV